MIDEFIHENGLNPVKLLHTHSHLDHVFGSGYIAKKYKLELWIHSSDEQTLKAFNLSANMYGVPIRINPPEKYHFFDMLQPETSSTSGVALYISQNITITTTRQL